MVYRRDEEWRRAVLRGHLGAVHRLCSRGYDPDRCSVPYDADGFGPSDLVPAVFYASKSDDRVALLEALHSAGASVVGAKDARGRALVHIAAQYGALEAMKKLVGWGADLSAVHDAEFNHSVAHEAAMNGRCSILRWLFNTDPTFVNKKLKNGYTPACASIVHGKLDALKVCVEYGCDVNGTILADDTDECEAMTLLDLAALMGDEKITKWLRKRGAKVTSESVNYARIGDAIPGGLRKRMKDARSLKEMKEAMDNIDLSSVKQACAEPIQRTADKKKRSLAQKLLSKVCDYCGHNTPGKPLMICTACRMVSYCDATCQKSHWKGHKPLCKAYQRGEEVNWPDANLALRLKDAIQDGDFDLVKHLVKVERFNLEDPINRFLNENEQDPKSTPPMTALQFAASSRSVIGKHAKRTVKLLVELGANLETTVSERGFTALFHAQNVRDIEMMELLRQLGANINARDDAGQTILHGAAYTETPLDLKIARMVASWEGFDLHAKDIKGFTARDWANAKGNAKMERLLEELGVSVGVDLDASQAQMKEMFGHIEAGRLSLADVGLDANSYAKLKQQVAMMDARWN